MKTMNQQTVPVRRTSVTVVSLTVVCVILAAGFVGLIAIYAPGNQSNPDQQATIDRLNMQLAEFIANQTNVTPYIQQIATLQAQLQQYANQPTDNDTITALRQQISSYEQHLALATTGTLYAQNTFTQNPNTVTQIFSGSTSYAGYVVVQATSTANSTYAQVQFTFGNVVYSYNQTIGLSGTAVLPVLPSIDANTFIVSIGNTQTDIANNTVTATSTFYY
jgi:hypothetical protein